MSTCCLCNKFFCKRKDGKGYQKRPLSTPIHFKHSQLTILEALKLFYNHCHVNGMINHRSSDAHVVTALQLIDHKGSKRADD